ncbi:MAG TPA: hypothetical protein VFF19_01600 [Reyranella sp.]|nr:hypothetical protein [Reyranella sp.]
MPGNLFAVINTRGPNWDDAKPMEDQVDWRAHADFMNGLTADGFVLLGGPFAGTRDVLLIVRAEDRNEVEARWRRIAGSSRACCEISGSNRGNCAWAPWTLDAKTADNHVDGAL